jgi:hypothetical protein
LPASAFIIKREQSQSHIGGRGECKEVVEMEHFILSISTNSIWEEEEGRVEREQSQSHIGGRGECKEVVEMEHFILSISTNSIWEEEEGRVVPAVQRLLVDTSASERRHPRSRPRSWTQQRHGVVMRTGDDIRSTLRSWEV